MKYWTTPQMLLMALMVKRRRMMTQTMDSNSKQGRVLERFFRGLCGENLSVKRLAEGPNISGKSISRDIAELHAFLVEHRELTGNAELRYSRQDRCYRLYMDEFLADKELFALVEVMIGARAFSRMELLSLVDKLERFAAPVDRPRMKNLIRRELYHYTEVKHDCESVQKTLWKLINCISERKEITISYYRMDRHQVEHRIQLASIMFADYYFYLIAFKPRGDTTSEPVYFRVDRITHITEHRDRLAKPQEFDEGLLRRRSLLMFPGKLRTIRFEFSGPSMHAVLDKLPTANIIERTGGKYLIEAEVYGGGIKMWLLSQGPWVKVVALDEFVDEMRRTLESTLKNYR